MGRDMVRELRDTGAHKLFRRDDALRRPALHRKPALG